MLRGICALVAGLLFGIGLALSQIIDPEKVLGFLDISGRWDPSLALVMAGALIIALPGYQLTLEWPMPLLSDRFELPSAHRIDARLVAGAALFGIGWGLIGFCPGAAIASLAYGMGESFMVVAAMAVGAWLYRATLAPKSMTHPAWRAQPPR